jgi:hypothetical protein
MMVRMQISLSNVELEALADWAADEFRVPREQVRFVVQHALREHGYLSQVVENRLGEGMPRNETKQ